MQKIVLIDYGMGNLSSVARKIDQFGAKPLITSDPNTILSSDKCVLPGVGHFDKAMKNIHDYGLLDALNELALVKKAPILGICLGMQLMTRRSEEGNSNGLGWIDAEVVRFKVDDTLTYKVPHIGWNSVTIQKSSTIMEGIEDGASFYFVHAYKVRCNNKKDVLTTTHFENSFDSAFEKENIFGVQYHPEKSHDTGFQLFKNFVSL